MKQIICKLEKNEFLIQRYERYLADIEALRPPVKRTEHFEMNNTEHLFSKVECCLVMFSCWVAKRTEHFAEQG